MNKIFFLVATIYAAAASADGFDDAYTCPRTRIAPSMALKIAALAPITTVDSMLGCQGNTASPYTAGTAASFLIKTYTSRSGEIVVTFRDSLMISAIGVDPDGVAYVNNIGSPSEICRQVSTGMRLACTPTL